MASPPTHWLCHVPPLCLVLSLSRVKLPDVKISGLILSIITTPRSLPEEEATIHYHPTGTIFVRLSLTKSHPWWHFCLLNVSQDHRKQDLIIIFKEQPGCAFIKHQPVICIFGNILTILHPFVEKSVVCKSALVRVRGNKMRRIQYSEPWCVSRPCGRVLPK